MIAVVKGNRRKRLVRRRAAPFQVKQFVEMNNASNAPETRDLLFEPRRVHR
jgi:hypothetical protein